MEISTILDGRLARLSLAHEIMPVDGALRVELDAEHDERAVGQLLTVRGVLSVHANAVEPTNCSGWGDEKECLLTLIPGRISVLVDAPPVLSGDVVEAAEVVTGPNGRPAMVIVFRPEAARRFAEHTGATVGQALAIAIDGIVVIAPVVQEQITAGQAIIVGPELQIAVWAAILNQRPLPARLEILSVEAAEPVARGRRRR